MPSTKPKLLALPFLALAAIFLFVACGTAAPDAASGADAAARPGQTMQQEPPSTESMEQTGEAMPTESMDQSGDTTTGKAMAEDTMMESVGALILDISGIQPLKGGFHYEGWAIIDDVPVTTGKFNVDSQGNLVDPTGQPIHGNRFQSNIELSRTSAIVITIEPAGDTDAIPAGTHYLSGDVVDGSAELGVGHTAALGDDFSDAEGVYILATPTNGPDTDENSGIWFLDLSSGSPAIGLELPQLPAGWEYEGWTVIDGAPVTSGRFTDAGEVDSVAPFSGPESGPPFPGEDYLRNAPEGITFPTDLAGQTAVISIEPTPDDSAAPFTLKPLVGAIPSNTADHINYELSNNSGSFPTGTATIGG